MSNELADIYTQLKRSYLRGVGLRLTKEQVRELYKRGDVRDELLAFVSDYVEIGYHHACTEGQCSHLGNVRMEKAKELLAEARKP